MRARSWMAPLAMLAGTSIALPEAPAQAPGSSPANVQSQEAQGASPPSKPATSKPADGIIPAVRLNLVIAGLGQEGCEVEVKPANASCKFRTFNERGVERRQHVPTGGTATVELRNIELRGADRTCAIAITVHEPRQETKTVYRGFRLTGRPAGIGAAASSVPSFTCFLSSPSKLARIDDSRSRK
jgi:hypothetical protein